VSLAELSARGHYNRVGDDFDPTGLPVYGQGRGELGTVTTALLEPSTYKMRYLVVNDGNRREFLLPVGQARIEDDAVYYDGLTSAQTSQLQPYHEGQTFSAEMQARDESLLTGRQVTGREPYDYSHQAFTAPQRLQLLEERLTVNKSRERVGGVEVGKRVETRTEQMAVTLTHEEVVIERRPVTDARPVEGATLGAESQTVRIDLEAERADVSKQAVVREEVEVGKREVSEQRTFTEQVRREELEVEQTGDVGVRGETDQDKRRG
jgi:uncharacterized protein (TIGR02271 family)